MQTPTLSFDYLPKRLSSSNKTSFPVRLFTVPKFETYIVYSDNAPGGSGRSKRTVSFDLTRRGQSMYSVGGFSFVVEAAIYIGVSNNKHKSFRRAKLQCTEKLFLCKRISRNGGLHHIYRCNPPFLIITTHFRGQESIPPEDSIAPAIRIIILHQED